MEKFNGECWLLKVLTAVNFVEIVTETNVQCGFSLGEKAHILRV